MARSWASVLQEKMSSREEISESMEPVRTQMKLYGIKPGGENSNGEICICGSLRYVCVCVLCWVSPMNTDKKKIGIGMLRTGQVMFRNQLGVIGKKRRKSRKKNKLLRFSFTWQRKEWEGKRKKIKTWWDKKKKKVKKSQLSLEKRGWNRRVCHCTDLLCLHNAYYCCCD